MRDYLDPYNAAQEDTAGRLRALGVMPTYQPPERDALSLYGGQSDTGGAGQRLAGGGSGLSWQDYKSANRFDTTDFEEKQRIWNEYRDKVIPGIAQTSGENPEALRAFFEQQYAGDRPRSPQRSAVEAINDTVLTAGNAAFQGMKTLTDLYDPRSAASQWLGERVQEGEDKSSAVMRDERLRRARVMAEAKARGDTGIPEALGYYVRNPLQAAAEAAGMVAPFAVSGGLMGAARLGGAAATAAQTGLGAAMGAGEVRGNIWDKISKTPDAQLQAESPEYAQLRQSMPEADAKAAVGANLMRNLPELAGAAALGAVSGRFGAERALAGLPTRFGRVGTAISETAQEAAQGAAEQLATNYAVQRALPGQSLSEDVALNAAIEGAMGGITGAVVGGHGQHAAAPMDATLPAAEPAQAEALALPAPVRALAAPPAEPGFVMGGGYAATPEDIADVVGGLKTVVRRDWLVQHLESDLRNGTLENTAQQQNSLGRAARALLERIRQRSEPRQLEAPEAVPALPSPEAVAPGGAMLVDTGGAARPQTYREASDASAVRMAAEQLGLTGDIRNAQEARARAAQVVDQTVEPGANAAVPGLPGAEGAEVGAEAGRPGDGAGAGPGQGHAAAAAAGGTADTALTAPILQNRNRSSAAAVAQMQAIAANPDAARLSFSRDFANGAPVVEANPGLPVPAEQLGREDFSVAADGRRIPVQYAVVEADTLLPSNRVNGVANPDYAAGRPDMLRAIAGNGRVAGLRSAYERGTAGAYRSGLADDAALTGVNPSVIARMHRPVVVRIMPREHVTADIGDVSNTVATAALSPVEQAQNDANRVDLETLSFDDAGDPTPAAVRSFIYAMPVAERVGLLNPDGTPTRQAVDRLMAATFWRAYGDPELVRLYAQATDPEAKTVLSGMAHAAGAMAQLEGAGDLDVRPIVAEAAGLAVNARRRGVKLQEFAKQADIAVDPDALAVVRLFADNSRSAGRIGEGLRSLAGFAHTEATKPGEDMFGTVERATRAQALEKLHDTQGTQNLAVVGRRGSAEDGHGGNAAVSSEPGNGGSAEAVGAARPAAPGQQAASEQRTDEPVAAVPDLLHPAASFSRDSTAGGISTDEVRRAIAADSLHQEVDVYETLADAPEYVRRQAEAAGATDVEGFFDPRTNRVALIAGNLASADRAREVARHELIGHYGLENMVGRATMRELATKVATAERLGNKTFRAIGAEVDRTQPGLPPDRRAKEIIALMAERNMQNSVMRRVMDAVRSFLKQLGVLRSDVTDAELAGLLRSAQQYLRERGRSIAAPGEVAPAALSVSGEGKGQPTINDLTPENRRLLQARYKAAVALKPEFDAKLRAIGRAINDETLLPPLKGKARAVDKIVSDYSGDASKIKDLLRGTIVAPNVNAAHEAIRMVREQFEIVGAPRNLLDPARSPGGDGYRDAKFNVRIGDETAEVQINVPEMIEAKEKAHPLYEQLSRLERDMRMNGESPAKLARWKRLKAQMREIYDEAWDRTLRTNSTNSSADSGLPLRRAESGEKSRGGSVSQAAENRPASGSPSDTGIPSPSKSKNSASGESSETDGTVARLSMGGTSNASISDNGAGGAEEPDGGALLSRSGATSIPLVEERQTVLDKMRQMARDPAGTKDAARTLLAEGGKAAQPKWLEDAVTNLFDYRNPLEQVVRRAGNTAVGKAFLNTMRTFEAAAQKTVHDFEDGQVKPMMGDIAAAWKKEFKDLPWYKEHGYRQFLQDIGTVGNLVKHGRERNAAIAAKTGGKDLAGSGRTNEEIAAIERDIRREAPGLVEFYESLYRDHLKPMLDYRDQTRRAAGLLTPEMDAARPKYQWYVPLFGDPNETEDGLAHKPSGADLKAPKEKQAMGRSGTLADNVLQNVLEATESTIRQAGMQQFKRDFIKLVKENPVAKGLMSAKINEDAHKEIFEKYVGPDGLVHQRVKPNAAMSPDAIVLRDGDRTTVVHVGNKKVLEALQGTNRGQVDGLFGVPAKATRFLSKVYTQWNPMFPLMNKLRDAQSQLSLVMADAPVKDKAAAARRAFANNVKYSAQWRDQPGSEYHRWKERYKKLGGSTMYSDLFDDDVMTNLEEDFAKLVGADTKHKLKAGAEKIGDFIDRVNEHMEMSSRVGLFKALVDSGMPEKDAARYVKDTMNFETRGKIGKQLGALYAFAGPALFDTRRMAQALRTPRGAAVMLAHFALMYSLYGALKAMGGQDDDGIDRLNKVPLSQAGRFLTMLDPNDPDGKGFKLPVGFGFGRIALTLAAAAHRFMDGVDDGGTFASNVAKDALLSNFSPVEPTDVDPSKDLAGWAMQQFTPTLMKPMLQLAMNQTGQGSPIHKPDEWTGNKLKFQQAWPQTSGLFRGLAKEIYDKTGVDVYPETLQFLLRSYGGGGALDGIKALELLGEKAGTDISLSDVPGLRSFGSRSLTRDMTEFRERSSDVEKMVNERKYAQEQGTLAEFDDAHPGVEQAQALFKSANKEIKGLFQERKDALAQEDPARRQLLAQEVSRRIRAVQMQANKAYREMQQQ